MSTVIARIIFLVFFIGMSAWIIAANGERRYGMEALSPLTRYGMVAVLMVFAGLLLGAILRGHA